MQKEPIGNKEKRSDLSNGEIRDRRRVYNDWERSFVKNNKKFFNDSSNFI